MCGRRRGRSQVQRIPAEDAREVHGQLQGLGHTDRVVRHRAHAVLVLSDQQVQAKQRRLGRAHVRQIRTRIQISRGRTVLQRGRIHLRGRICELHRLRRRKRLGIGRSLQRAPRGVRPTAIDRHGRQPHHQHDDQRHQRHHLPGLIAAKAAQQTLNLLHCSTSAVCACSLQVAADLKITPYQESEQG